MPFHPARNQFDQALTTLGILEDNILHDQQFSDNFKLKILRFMQEGLDVNSRAYRLANILEGEIARHQQRTSLSIPESYPYDEQMDMWLSLKNKLNEYPNVHKIIILDAFIASERDYLQNFGGASSHLLRIVQNFKDAINFQSNIQNSNQLGRQLNRRRRLILTPQWEGRGRDRSGSSRANDLNSLFGPDADTFVPGSSTPAPTPEQSQSRSRSRSRSPVR